MAAGSTESASALVSTPNSRTDIKADFIEVTRVEGRHLPAHLADEP
jgi:hypothetical protein